MAGDGSNTGLYEPLLPPLYDISRTSHGAYALIAALIMLLISGMAVLVKLQLTTATFRKLRRDDFALIAALVFAVGYTIALCRSVRSGLGRTAEALTDAEHRELGRSYLASNILLYLSLAASKCSLALLVIAIQPRRWVAMSLYCVAGVSIAWALVAILVTALQYGSDRSVLGPTSNDSCIDQYGAAIGVKLVDILTYVALAVLPGMMMLSVQVSVPKRVAVSFIFGLRIITPVFTAVSLARLASFYEAPTHARPFEAVSPSIWTSIALNVSLITACLPSIKRFLLDWAAGVSNGLVGEAYDFQQSSSGGKSRPAQASGIRSFMRSQGRSHVMSSGSRSEEDATYSTYARGSRRNEQDGVADDGDSKKGLTDGILQTVDYQVHFEQDRHAWNGSSSSEGRTR